MNEQTIINYLLGECTMDERKEMEAWLAADERHQAEYQKTVRAWEWSRRLATGPTPDLDAAWLRFVALRDAHPKKRNTVVLLPLLRLAASILLVACLAALFVGMITPAETWRGKTFTSAQSVLKDTLADGTVLTLNSNSTLRVHPTLFARQRRVSMERGEAFFEVARNERKPFEVQAGATRVVVLGTSFNMRKDGPEVDVVVASGQVSVSNGAQTTTLGAMQRVTVNERDGSFVATDLNALLDLHYANDRFVLRNTPLKDVVKFLADEYKANILIAEPALENLLLTATLGKDSLDKLLHVIAETLDIEVSHNNNTYILHR